MTVKLADLMDNPRDHTGRSGGRRRGDAAGISPTKRFATRPAKPQSFRSAGAGEEAVETGAPADRFAITPTPFKRDHLTSGAHRIRNLMIKGIPAEMFRERATTSSTQAIRAKRAVADTWQRKT